METTIRKANVEKVADKILFDTMIDNVDCTETYYFSGNLKQNISNLYQGEKVNLVVNLQNGVCTIIPEDPTKNIEVVGKVDIKITWKPFLAME